MEVVIEHNNEHEVKLAVSVDWCDIQTDYENLLKSYCKVPIKGFRPNHAPVSAIERVFKKEIHGDLAASCSERLCRKALIKEQLKAGSPITVSNIDIQPQKHFLFTADFLKMPEFTLPDYAHFNLQAESEEDKCTEISEKLLEKTSFLLHNDFILRELTFLDTDENISEQQQRKAAEDRVKLLLILKKIADQDNVEIDEKDVNERIEKIAKENDVTTHELKEYLLENGGLSRLRDFLLAEYVLSYIIELNQH